MKLVNNYLLNSKSLVLNFIILIPGLYTPGVCFGVYTNLLVIYNK